MVKDDGIGFDIAASDNAAGAKGNGIHNMRERTELLKGQFNLESYPDKGTTVSVKTSLDFKNEQDQGSSG